MGTAFSLLPTISPPTSPATSPCSKRRQRPSAKRCSSPSCSIPSLLPSLRSRSKSRSEGTSSTALSKLSSPLHQFIQLECPVVLQAIRRPADLSLRVALIRHFSNTFDDHHFDEFADVIAFLERLRWKRLQKLLQSTQFTFVHTPSTRFSCLPCRINDFVTLAYFDTGCSVSCVTLATARRLQLARQIDFQLQGVAIGFGSNRKIIGCLQSIPVQVAPKLILCVDFVVIGRSSADFLLLGADLMQRIGLCIDYRNARIRFPKQKIAEHSLQFISNEPSERSLHLQQFKSQLLSESYCAKSPYETNVMQSGFSSAIMMMPPFRNINDNESWSELRNGNLYVPVQIRQCRLLALIDSGADSSKMSESLAEQLHLLQLVDDRQSRLSHGLGSVLSIGRLPPIPIRFDRNKLLYVPFEVLQERKLHLLLLGSDFFTHYACQVDFKHNQIVIPLQDEHEPLRFRLVRQPASQSRRHELSQLHESPTSSQPTTKSISKTHLSNSKSRTND